ncbi:MAG: HAD family phosphatase, partial [Candidatus Parcubacteria bacterium]|nr:HAD family phosphatase [Candidatus Parcubacteria bacterium]
MIKAVIFDQDGVIIDSEKINLASALFSFEQLGIKIDDQDKKTIIGIHPTDYKNIMLAKYDFDFDRYVQIKRDYYSQALISAPLFTKTVNIIRQLKQKNIPLGMVTSSKRVTNQEILKRAGLDKVFKAIICFEDCEQRKPAPDCYLSCASKLNVLPYECLAIEDSQPGLTAAKGAGMTCFVIPNQTTQNQDFSRADKVIDYDTELDIELFE